MRRVNEAMLKKLLLLFTILLLLAVFGIAVLFSAPRRLPAPGSAGSAPNAAPKPERGSIHLLQQLSVADFSDEEGNPLNLSAYRGQALCVSFWASYCPACNEQLDLLLPAQGFADAYDDFKHLYINRTDGEKETVQSAADYARKRGFYEAVLFDRQRKTFDALGIKKIPSTLFLDESGRVRFFKSGSIESIREMSALTRYVKDGAALATADFVERSFTRSDGGIKMHYGDSDRAVLSESLGILLEYAVLVKDHARFDAAYRYLRDQMRLRNGLFSWQLDETGKASAVNALLDDLRILRALDAANKLWGGYETDHAVLKSAIRTHLVRDGIPVDYYNSDTRRKSESFTLCHADFTALRLLNDESLLENALSVVKAGYISDSFPLYYSAYDSSKKTYDQEKELHTAEALMTLYHLSQEGVLSQSSLNWLREQVYAQDLAARYRTDGTIPEGYDYPSSAVYALSGLIALQENDEALFTASVWEMERLRTNLTGDPFDGAFGSPTDREINVFDQLLPMLLYAKAGM